MAGPESDTPGLARPELVRVLESAARLQEVLPDAVLVGGSAALADRYGIARAADVLRHIDAYYSDQRGPGPEGAATQLARQLADPKPKDARTIGQLGRYKGLDARWADWGHVTGVCRSLAVEMTQ